jgi:AmiR/NasT family two-component response regulator
MVENRHYPVYPKGLILVTKRSKYEIVGRQVIKNKYVFAYVVKNLKTKKVYPVAYSLIHSSRYQLESPAARVLFETSLSGIEK